MAKSEKEKKVTGKVNTDAEKSTAKKPASKPVKQDDEDDDDLDDEIEETPAKKKSAKASSSKKGDDDDDDEEDTAKDEEVDEWNKVEEDENWDPDFDEFDVPKSKGKKAATGTKKPVEEEDDLKVDDEFKDMFNDSDDFGEEEDDY